MLSTEENNSVKLEINDISLKRSDIENNPMIKLSDRDELTDLDMFCYTKCDNNDDKLIKECRGVVFCGDKMIMKAFPYTVEFESSDVENINNFIGEEKLDELSFFDSYEGTLIRMFYYSAKWYISTHRKLDAFKSRWASKESFGTSFVNALEEELNTNDVFRENISKEYDNVLDNFKNILDKNKQYMFLVRNTKENRIVCDAPEKPKVYHVGTFVDGKLVLDDDVYLSKPTKLSFNNVEELCVYVNNLNFKEFQGVIVFGKDKYFKIVRKEYQELFRVRGNEPSIKFRYLKLRLNKKYTDMLYYLYPDMVETFDNYENMLYDKACEIYQFYVNRYIKKQFVTLPKNEYKVLEECHSWYLENRSDNKISIEKVIEVLNKQTPSCLNHMIKQVNYKNVNQTLPQLVDFIC